VRTYLFVVYLLLITPVLSGQQGDTALLLIDIQEFYFDTAKSPLAGNLEASEKAARLLAHFREKELTVIHVMHKGGGEIHRLVSPAEGEKIIVKENVSCFRETGLTDCLHETGISTLVIAGMMTHMCVEAAVRAGADLGFDIVLIHDACATKDLQYDGEVVKAKDVHLSTLSTLRSYAKILSTDDFLGK
jgi:nicotinamidase-related amidase